MKAKHTYIEQTTATRSSVEIVVQPRDTDEGHSRITMRVVPTNKGCIICVSGLGDQVVGQVLAPGNHAELVWMDQDEANKQTRQVQTLKRLLADKDRDYERLFLWLRTAMDKPNGFQLWADTNKAQGHDPMALILKGTPTSAVILKG